MRVKKFNSNEFGNINTRKYSINWEKSGNSKLEIKFRELIYPYWKHSIVLFQPTIPGCKLKLDFLNVNKRLAVEIDGPQHNDFNAFFHNNSKNVYAAGLKRDLDKSEWCRVNNIEILRLIEEDLNLFSPKYIWKKFDVEIV